MTILIWIGWIFLIHFLAGALLVGWFIGSDKRLPGWSARQAWNQFRSHHDKSGIPGWVFWTIVASIWFPTYIFVILTVVVKRIRGLPHA